MATKKTAKKAVARRRAAYDPRLATARALSAQVVAMSRMAGLMVKAVRDYKAGGEGLETQAQIARAAGVSQALISNLECGEPIPAEASLTKIVDAMGLDTTKPGSAALLELLRFLRTHGRKLAELEREPPE